MERANEGFNFGPFERADVMLCLELVLYDAVKLREMLGNGWFVGRGISLGYDGNAGVEAVLELVREVWVSCDEACLLEKVPPGCWFIRGFCISFLCSRAFLCSMICFSAARHS